MTNVTLQADTAYEKLIRLEASAETSSDELFCCAYLLGHLSLISGQELMDSASLDQLMHTSLQQAFTIDRLSDQDKTAIVALWDNVSLSADRD
ncbi:YfcL family protein [Nitrincola sp.]|uniref:YfcL family protein n=1 Tax=Nitrincola sp. TaxID=1926584 RepID=UPI003A94502D